MAKKKVGDTIFLGKFQAYDKMKILKRLVKCWRGITSRRFPHKYVRKNRREGGEHKGDTGSDRDKAEATFQSSHLSCKIDCLNPGDDCLSNISFSTLKSIEVCSEESSHNTYAS